MTLRRSLMLAPLLAFAPWATSSPLNVTLPLGLPVLQPGNNTSTASSSKMVTSMFKVANAMTFSAADWTRNFELASSTGIDSFELLVAHDPTQLIQVEQALTAAALFKPDFKLFISFDMSSFQCATAEDITPIRLYLTPATLGHPSYATYQGSPLVSTLGGEQCTFGTSDLNSGWTRAVKPQDSSNSSSRRADSPGIFFIPAFNVRPETLPALTVMDGAANYNSSWSMTSGDLDFGADDSYIGNLGGRLYMGAASPWYSSHTAANNRYYRSDDWLFASRWEQIIQHRDLVPLVQVISWNVYDDSTYMGPAQDQPQGSAAEGYDHQGWLSLLQYYVTAYKTGTYPTIANDELFLWGRLYPKDATAVQDPLGKPINYQFAEDSLWAVALLKEPAQVLIGCGMSQTTNLPAGAHKLRLPLTDNCEVQAAITRASGDDAKFAPSGFTFSTKPETYNFNAFVSAFSEETSGGQA